jgi:hypothetical protein
MNTPVYPIEGAFPEVVAAAHETALGDLVDVANRGLELPKPSSIDWATTS